MKQVVEKSLQHECKTTRRVDGRQRFHHSAFAVYAIILSFLPLCSIGCVLHGHGIKPKLACCFPVSRICIQTVCVCVLCAYLVASFLYHSSNEIHPLELRYFDNFFLALKNVCVCVRTNRFQMFTLNQGEMRV